VIPTLWSNDRYGKIQIIMQYSGTHVFPLRTRLSPKAPS
jgi:hypothetical protein